MKNDFSIIWLDHQRLSGDGVTDNLSAIFQQVNVFGEPTIVSFQYQNTFKQMRRSQLEGLAVPGQLVIQIIR
ncbi:MAG: hypothetical protein GY758_07805 [Fuerstiella sp.]|jgi:hypothetical protein|nr:hypothetical protein [Fuerstiella sp.]MCP4509347.1 hypothetical protein [Fuerstiella sp.]MDG2129490.1 hypothetical protein [Fuerstiella sp.]